MDEDETVLDCDEDNAEAGNGMLTRMRSLIKEYYAAVLDSAEEESAMRAVIVVFEGLDGHLTKGGSLPTDWDVAP